MLVDILAPPGGCFTTTQMHPLASFPHVCFHVHFHEQKSHSGAFVCHHFHEHSHFPLWVLYLRPETPLDEQFFHVRVAYTDATCMCMTLNL